MVRENSFDRVTDKVASKVGRAKAKVHSYFKGTNPYRQEPMSDEDRITNYMKWANNPEMEQELRQQFGDESIDTIRNNMHDLINRGR